MISKQFWVGGTLLVGLMVLVAVVPWITTHDPSRIDPLVRLQGASQGHLMGTDALGRDILSRSLSGGRTSMVIGVSVASIAIVAGTALGLLAGFVRWLDSLIMRIMDGLMTIPSVLMATALIAFMRPSIGTVIFAVALTEIPKVARLVRALALRLREQPFIEAAQIVGTPLRRVLIRHVLPNMSGLLIVQGTLIVAWAILIEATLSFLGVGLPPQVPSWGNMMAEGRSVVFAAPHVVLWPGLQVAITVLALHLLGDGLRDAMDPRGRDLGWAR